MGDVVSLVEKATEAVGERDMKDVARRMKSGQFNLEDFLQQMQQMRDMGPLTGLLDMLPGGGQMAKQMAGVDLDEGFFTHSEAIVLSMTPAERRDPDLLNGSRRRDREGLGHQPGRGEPAAEPIQGREEADAGDGRGQGGWGLGRLLGF